MSTNFKPVSFFDVFKFTELTFCNSSLSSSSSTTSQCFWQGSDLLIWVLISVNSCLHPLHCSLDLIVFGCVVFLVPTWAFDNDSFLPVPFVGLLFSVSKSFFAFSGDLTGLFGLDFLLLSFFLT